MSISEMANKLHEYDLLTKSCVLYGLLGAFESMEENNRITAEVYEAVKDAYETGIQYGKKLD